MCKSRKVKKSADNQACTDEPAWRYICTNITHSFEVNVSDVCLLLFQSLGGALTLTTFLEIMCASKKLYRDLIMHKVGLSISIKVGIFDLFDHANLHVLCTFLVLAARQSTVAKCNYALSVCMSVCACVCVCVCVFVCVCDMPLCICQQKQDPQLTNCTSCPSLSPFRKGCSHTSRPMFKRVRYREQHRSCLPAQTLPPCNLRNKVAVLLCTFVGFVADRCMIDALKLLSLSTAD